MGSKRHQHFVPRAYLRFFSHKSSGKERNPDMLYRWDKKEKTSLEISVADAAVGKNIYTDKQLENESFWEEEYSKREKAMSKTLKRIVDKARLNVVRENAEIISEDDRCELADIIVMQMLRTQKTMNYLEMMCFENFCLIMDFLKNNRIRCLD